MDRISCILYIALIYHVCYQQWTIKLLYCIVLNIYAHYLTRARSEMTSDPGKPLIAGSVALSTLDPGKGIVGNCCMGLSG